MGKVKGILEEDMARNPDLYDGGMDYEYWSYINKKKKKKPTKRRSNVRKRKKSS